MMITFSTLHIILLLGFWVYIANFMHNLENKIDMYIDCNADGHNTW